MAHDSGLDDETLAGGTPDDYEPPDGCPICGGYEEWQTCWQCGGDGDGGCSCCDDLCHGAHEAGVACMHGDEPYDCSECKGEGNYRVCTALPHTDEQMTAYRLRVESKQE